MKVLMFGWEFPPFMSGGLGTACYGLTKALCDQDVEVTFVMPKAKGELDGSSTHVNLVIADRMMKAMVKEAQDSGCKLTVKQIDSILHGYTNSENYAQMWYEKAREKGLITSEGFLDAEQADEIYGGNLGEEVERFAERSKVIADSEEFDVIHAHDWITFPAALAAKHVTGKPFIAHIHATEFDRTAGSVNQYVYDIERMGIQESDMVIANSHRIRQMCIEKYGAHPDKVKVVHNAVDFSNCNKDDACAKLSSDDKVVLFLGRLTQQKGPLHFLWAAKKVLEVEPDAKFVVAGSGDMGNTMVEEAARLGIADKVIFTGFLQGPEIDKAYKMADLYVMPSVSEPFGITPLESMRNGTPTLISKQSGVSEILNHCLKVDFWDIDQMANKMASVLKYSDLHQELQSNGTDEVYTITWDAPATKCIDIYNCMLD